MATGISGAATTSCVVNNPILAAAVRRRSWSPLADRALPFSPLTRTARWRGLETVTCFVLQDAEKQQTPAPAPPTVPVPVPSLEEEAAAAATRRIAERRARKQSERRTYLVAAVMSSLGVTSMAVAAVYYRFHWQLEGGEVSMTEMFGTFALSVGAASHHRAREGPFELNDVFAIINAVPAISLLAYGLFHRGLVPGLCFGAGLGITLFGIAYMFVHDGLVHRRFPVGPIANVPYFRRVAAAHKIHHTDKFEGVPYGLFLGPKELEEVGGMDELEKELARIKRSL
ncbi:hypothetical protein GUJ93_ZPchr0014g47400 [Zizania palustris]|uniref:beta-carotene 3-hydroxylase n=1 Tax=Zizania palustris TaxID=103762 RepID=A0A8J5SXX5_ZIZPA|nr:hypothetical protein GUJ93_ZPchr0014g47400 [Zizania palustris]